MKSTKLFLDLIKIIFLSVQKSELFGDLLEWENERKTFNYKVNHLIIKYLSTKRRTNQHLLLDAKIHFYLKILSKRELLIDGKSDTKLTKYIFLFKCLTTILKELTYLIVKPIYEIVIKHYYLPKIDKNQQSILFIGFPYHAFNLSDTRVSYPSSMFESIKKTHNVNKSNLFVFEGYSLKKYSKIRKEGKIRSFNHIKILHSKKINSFKKLLRLFKLTLNQLDGFSLTEFSYLFNQIARTEVLKGIFNDIKKNSLDIKIIAISTANLGLYKYNSEGWPIEYFNYSRNNIVPSSKKLVNCEFDNNLDISPSEILQEIDVETLSFTYHKSLGLSGHNDFYSLLRGKINKRFELNLDTTKMNSNKNSPASNLGYLLVEKLELIQNKINVLIVDQPSETLSEHYRKRAIFGDVAILKDFELNFHEDLSKILLSNKINIYYKGKYSDINQKYDKLVLYKKRVFVINDYSKLDLNVKFDFLICQPYSSAYFTMSRIALNTLYYVPKKYESLMLNDFKVINLCTYSLLENTIFNKALNT